MTVEISEADLLLMQVGAAFLGAVCASAWLGHTRVSSSVKDYIARPEYPPTTLKDTARLAVLDTFHPEFTPAEILERHPWIAEYGRSVLANLYAPEQASAA